MDLVKEYRLVNFVNGREDAIFTPAHLKDCLKTKYKKDVHDNFVHAWLNQRLKQKDISRLNHGIYRRNRVLESEIRYWQRILGEKHFAARPAKWPS